MEKERAKMYATFSLFLMLFGAAAHMLSYGLGWLLITMPPLVVSQILFMKAASGRVLVDLPKKRRQQAEVSPLDG